MRKYLYMAKHLGVLIACHTAKAPVLSLSPQRQTGIDKEYLIAEKQLITLFLVYRSFKKMMESLKIVWS